MLTRLQMIGAIRDMLPELWEQGRFELAKEIMGGIHRDDFTGVSDATVARIWKELRGALSRPQDETCPACNGCGVVTLYDYHQDRYYDETCDCQTAD